MRFSVVVGVAAILAGARTEDVDVEVAGNSLDNNMLNVEPVNKSLKEMCSSVNPMSCLKHAIVRGLERLSRWPPSLELMPGLTVRGDLTGLQDLPREVTSSQPDEALLRGLARYLSSLSLTVRVMDNGVLQRIQEFGEKITQDPENTSTARRKPFGGAMGLAGLMSGGTMLALGMAAIAAMAGKAMMASLLSLMMSAMASMKGNGGDKGGSYEIIHAHEHKHRSFDSEGDSSFNYPTFALPPSANRRNTLMPFIRRR